jgi:hypothetical protein
VLVHEVTGIAPLEGRADEDGALRGCGEGDQFFCDGRCGIRVTDSDLSIYSAEGSREGDGELQR